MESQPKEILGIGKPIETQITEIPPWKISRPSRVDQILEEKEKKEEEVVSKRKIFYKRCLYTLIPLSFFTYISLFFVNNNVVNRSIIISLLLNLSIFIAGKIYLLIILILFLALIIYIFDYAHKESKSHLSFITNIFKITFFSLLLSLILTFPALYLFGFSHLNILSFYLALNQSSTLALGGKEVLTKLNQMNTIPEINLVFGNLNENILKLVIRNNSKSYGNYYKYILIRDIPDSLIYKPDIPNASVSMFQDKLFFREINKDEIEMISPRLGKLFAQSYFMGRYIKDIPPKLVILGRQDYLQYKEKNINIEISKIDMAISKNEAIITELKKKILANQQYIIFNENNMSVAIANRDRGYSDCINSGYTDFVGSFHRYYSDSYCSNFRTQIDYSTFQIQNNINNAKSSLLVGRNLLQYYINLSSYLKELIDSMNQRKADIIYEYGNFVPPETITIALDYTSLDSLSNYVATLIHEYYHYASFVSVERNLPPFFEEGLTELFARKTMGKLFYSSPNLGYPVLMEVMKEMAKKIPESQLSEIYLTKDKVMLVSVLNSIYGTDFYNNYELYFETLPYLNFDDQINAANILMASIGGRKLTQEEFGN